MTSRGPAEGEPECVVIGGGLSGLAAAHGLARAGRRVHVLEAQEELGGRARTAWHRGRPVDRGFQVLLRGYGEVRALARDVGVPRHDLRAIGGGAVFLGPSGWHQLAPGPLSLSRFGGLEVKDRARLARLGAELFRSPEAALSQRVTEAPTAERYLSELGFGSTAIEGFFRPLFGPILLDRTLSSDPGYFRWLLGMLVRGAAVIPSDGLGMIGVWTESSLRQLGGIVETGARVARLHPDETATRVAAIELEDGRRLEPSYVVLATDPPAAATLLGDLDPGTVRRLPLEPAGTITAAFALRRPLYRGKAIVLDADPPAVDRDRVDLVCQTTNITRPGIPEGPHVLLAARVTTGGITPEGIEDAMARLAKRWAPGVDWDRDATHIGTYEHPFAQFRVTPEARADLPGPRTALDNLILAGDLVKHPSTEGAVASGAQAARVVDALLP